LVLSSSVALGHLGRRGAG